MRRIEMNGKRWRGRGTEASRSRRLRPTAMALEDRTLLSTLMVDSTADDGSAGTLRWAIGQANASNQADTIEFSSLFAAPHTITLTAGQLVLTDKATTAITGPGANLLTISGNHASRVFDVSGSAAISGLTITGGSADGGAGLRNDAGTLTLTNCTVSGNAATDQGGGLDNFGGALTLAGCTVSNNTAPIGAGLAGSGGTLSLVNTTVSGNTATVQGGGLYLRVGTATLTNVTVSANSAATGGGLVNSGNTATVTLTNTIIGGNNGGDVTGNYGGGNNMIGVNPLLGILYDFGGPTFTMPPLPGSPAIGKGAAGAGVPSTDQRGFARGGSIDIGAFQTQGAASMVVNVTTDGPGSGLGQLNLRQAINLANIEPGTNTVSFSPSVFGTTPRTITLTEGEIGLGAAGSPVVAGPGASLLSIIGNHASSVFVHSAGSAVLSGLTITGGGAQYGGGVSNNGGTLSLADCIITGNTAFNLAGGGGLSNSGTMTLTNCTISGNSAPTGGGLATRGIGSTTLTGCTVSGNSASGFGGGLSIDGTTALTNCTVSGNSANYGGGLATTTRWL